MEFAGGVTRVRRSLPVLAAAALAAALAPVLAGCAGPGPPAAVPGPGVCTVRVTPDCSGYTYRSPAPGAVVVTAPRSSGGNDREFFWGRPTGGPASTVCATFASGHGVDQQGVVLRLREAPDGAVRAVTVTRNVWAGAFDVVNVHVWDTAADPAAPFTLVGSTEVAGLAVRPATYPLHLCARIPAGTDRVEFVAWSAGGRPAWGDPHRGGSATLPAGAPDDGGVGWFAGHLAPGTSMTYRDLTVDGDTVTGLP